MITKERYCDMMQRWALLDSDMRQLNDVCCRLFDTDLNMFVERYEELILDAITYGMNDEEDWTGYFAFERDFNLDAECVSDKDGHTIDTRSWEKVYDLIVDSNRALGVKDS